MLDQGWVQIKELRHFAFRGAWHHVVSRSAHAFKDVARVAWTVNAACQCQLLYTHWNWNMRFCKLMGWLWFVEAASPRADPGWTTLFPLGWSLPKHSPSFYLQLARRLFQTGGSLVEHHMEQFCGQIELGQFQFHSHVLRVTHPNIPYLFDCACVVLWYVFKWQHHEATCLMIIGRPSWKWTIHWKLNDVASLSPLTFTRNLAHCQASRGFATAHWTAVQQLGV